jgi:hypothetical protein
VGAERINIITASQKAHFSIFNNPIARINQTKDNSINIIPIDIITGSAPEV